MDNIIPLLKHITSQDNWPRLLQRKQYEQLRRDVFVLTPNFPPDSNITERVLALLNGLTNRPICPTCSTAQCSWNKDARQYRKHCSSAKCKQRDPSTIAKRKKTSLERYGAENIMQTSQGITKQQQTMVERYGDTHAAKVDHLKAKIQRTNLERYGTHATCLNDDVKQKQIDTRRQRYGVDYPLESEIIRGVATQTVLDRYGVTSTSMLPEVRLKQRLSWYNNNLHKYPFLQSNNDRILRDMYVDRDMSQSEIADVLGCTQETISRWLKKHQIDVTPRKTSYLEKQVVQFIREHVSQDIVLNTRSLIAPKEVDVWIPDLGVAFEINGIFFHGELNGRCHKTYHNEKTVACHNEGVKLIHITSAQWYLKRDIVESRILAKLGIFQSRIYARATSIVQLSNSDSVKFLEDNHIQGSCPSTVNYGLLYNNTLVAVMTFGKARFDKQHQWELLRYCNSLNTTVVGGASKLFKYFIQQMSPRSVVTYSDRSWNCGELYEALGFTFKHTSSPNFWVFHRDRPLILHHRLKFQKHKLDKVLDKFDPTKTAWQNLVDNGYDRYWDCGNDVWIWNDS